MAAVAKLPEVPPKVDWSKPVQMRWWKFPKGEYVGNSATESIAVKRGNQPASHLNDGYDCSGVVETIERQPDGVVLVSVRCMPTPENPDGLRTLVFDVGGHGAPL